MERPTFGAWLRQRRTEAGLTQDQLADAIGRDRTYVVRIENGHVKLPRADIRAEIHRALNTSDDELARFGIIDPPGAPRWMESKAPFPRIGETRPEYDSTPRANPFERNDPRWQFVEALRQLDLDDEYDAYVALTAYTLLRTMQTERATLQAGIVGAFRSPGRAADPQ